MSPALDWFGTALSLGGLVVVLAALWRIFRAGGMRRHSGTGGFDPQERRRFLRLIRADPQRCPPLSDPDLADARRVAAGLAAQRWLIVAAAGLITVQAGAAIQRSSVGSTVVSALIAAVLAAAIGFMARDMRRAKRFLARHER